MYKLYAHHKGTDHGGQGQGGGPGVPGGGNGNGNNIPEIDGGELPLAILMVFCVVLFLKAFRKSS